MSLFTTLVGGKLVVGAFAVGSIALGGTAAVAATGSLPTSLQEQAHTAFGAPEPLHEEDAVATPADTESTDPTDTESTDPAETEATDPAETAATEPGDSETPDSDPTTDPSVAAAPVVAPGAHAAAPASVHGLCTAWTHGGLPVHSTAYVRLVAASEGADLATWCAPHLGTVARAEDSGAGSDEERRAPSTSGRHHVHPGGTRSQPSAGSDEQGDQEEQGDEAGHDEQDAHGGQDSAAKDREHSQDSGGSDAAGSDHDGSDGSSD